METVSTPAGEKINQRRSQRVLLSVPVVVSGQAPDKKPISEETRTVVVNAHGALILLRMKVSIGQLLTLKHAKTGEEQACRVVNIAPRQSDKSEVGIEFMKPAPFFWHIAFPPPDWTSRAPEAKGYTPRSAPQPAAQQSLRPNPKK